MTLVPNANFTSGTGTITPDDFCQHIPLNLAELDGIYGSPQYSGWGDPQISCTVPTSSSTTTTSTSSPTTTSTSSPTVTTTTLVGSTSAAALPFALWGNEDPTMENSALESLLDSTTASTNSFGAELTTLKATNQVSTTSTGPSELWPYNHTESVSYTHLDVYKRQPEQLVWIVISGAGLFLVGSLGRRQVQRARR